MSCEGVAPVGPWSASRDRYSRLIGNTAFRTCASICLACVAASCATPLGVIHGAHVVPQGTVEVKAIVARAVPSGSYGDIIKRSSDVSTQLAKALKGGGSIGLDPQMSAYLLIGEALQLADLPAMVNELSVRTGIAPGVDLGLRYSGSSARAETFVQAWRNEGYGLCVGFGGTYALPSNGGLGIAAKLGLLAVTEMDLDATVVGGIKWSHGEIYLGPKGIFSNYWGSGALLSGDPIHIDAFGVRLDADVPLGIGLEHAWLVGGVIGGRVQWAPVQISLEVAIFQAFYWPRVFSKPVPLNGLILFPSVSVGVSL